MNRIQVFPITTPSVTKLDEALNEFLDMVHRHEHRLIDIKYSTSQGPLTEGLSREIYSALVIYEEKGNHEPTPGTKK